MKFKVVVNFHKINVIEINVGDAEGAAKSVFRLFDEERLKPTINEVSVFDIEDEFSLRPPIYVLKT
jgi:hypothetical protein